MPVNREQPLWRSLLYVPAHVDRYVDDAHTRGADCIILDLEDSVPPQQKALARARAASAAAGLRSAGCDVVVRVNNPLPSTIQDIEAVVGPDVLALAIPKVRNAEHVQLLDEMVSQAELRRGIADRHTGFILIVESCDAYFHMADIAKASNRAIALMLGGEDLALEAGFEPCEETLLAPKQQMVLAAAAAGVAALGLVGSPSAFARDLDAFRAMALRSRRFGFVGATCIHPAQVPILNEAFSPTAEEVAHARRIVQAYEDAAREGRGAFAVDRRMVDAPIVMRARRLLARHAAIESMASRPLVPAGGAPKDVTRVFLLRE